MAKHTKELQTLWWDWLATAERLTQVLHVQTAALTLRKVEKVEEVQPQIESLMSHMQEVDNQAAALAQELAGELGAEPNLRSLVSVLEKAEAQQVQALANRVIIAGRNVQTLIEKNRALIENELDYLHGTAAILIKEAQEQPAGYGQTKSGPSNLIVDQAA